MRNDKRNETKRNETKRNETVLLVENDQREADAIIAALKSNGFNHEVVHAANGIGALEFIFGTGKYAGRDATNRPSLILLDFVQDGDAHGFLRIIRAYMATGAIPVIALSRREEERGASKPELAVSGYIHKPFTYDEFSGTLSKLGLRSLLQ